MELEGEPIRFRPTHAAVFKKCKQEIIIVFGLKFITEQSNAEERGEENVMVFVTICWKNLICGKCVNGYWWFVCERRSVQALFVWPFFRSQLSETLIFHHFDVEPRGRFFYPRS
jgi:hypothetical protein